MYGLTLRSEIAVGLVVSCSVAHASSVADYRIDTGASVANQWVWMKASGGEVLSNFTQISRTFMDQNSGPFNQIKKKCRNHLHAHAGRVDPDRREFACGRGCLVADDAVVNKGIWPLQLTGQGDLA